MAFEGRSHVFPQAVIFGARPLPIPGTGHVMCSSAVLPFQLADGKPVKPVDYFKAVADIDDGSVPPDTMAPLPGAELLILGSLPPIEDDQRDVTIRCGELRCQLQLQKDLDWPDRPFRLGPESALWHEQDNPMGRAGPNDDRRPLITMTNTPERPIWLGPTSYLHPARARLMGTSEKTDAGGWPEDAHPSALCEAHSAFWVDSLHPGDPIHIAGLTAKDIDIRVPYFRPCLASSREPDGLWFKEFVRIHTVVLLPAAELGAIIWRSSIDLGKDILGETITALVFALEDISAPEKDEQDLAAIAAERWINPVAALDDRPLLPDSMAEKPPELDSSAFDSRIAAANAWARTESGVEDVNPFKDPSEVEDIKKTLGDDTQVFDTDLNELEEIRKKLMAKSKERHEKAGFPEPDLESLRPPMARKDMLEDEINRRLSAPYQAQHELTILESLMKAPPEARVKPEETLNRLASVRVTAIEPVLFWPALPSDEGEQFGLKAAELFQKADPKRHVDISSALILAIPGDEQIIIRGRTFDGLLAEETRWNRVEFYDCVFQQCSFAKSHFEDCQFINCTFDIINFSKSKMERLLFRDCQFTNLSLIGMDWIDIRVENCELKTVSFNDWAARDTVFTDGFWENVQVNEGFLVDVAFENTNHCDVIWAMTHAPRTRFERVTLTKFWVTGLGFPESSFNSVKAKNCAFLGSAYLNSSSFTNTSFTETGFSKATFNDAEFRENCLFNRCDFSSSVFFGALLANVKFLNCSMTSSLWGGGIDATSAWFHGCLLRNVDFADTALADAVFSDADIEGAIIDDDLAVGADFRGTTRC
ncbi:MAG: pentapeptide repeat-containing protein [Aestuariivita sp.]|nr:pentapeptide repeat-containing protein [Aestuariivita sp.]